MRCSSTVGKIDCEPESLAFGVGITSGRVRRCYLKDILDTHQALMERWKRKGRTARPHQHSTALAGWNGFHLIAERMPGHSVAVEQEIHLIVWLEGQETTVEE